MQRKYDKSIHALLHTDLISPQTKAVLLDRLEQLEEKYVPGYFDADLFRLLTAVSNRLIPQDDNQKYIDLAASIDRRLKEGKNDGWRFAVMPPDGESYRLGLYAINESSIISYGKYFTELSTSEQDEILTEVQKGKPVTGSWLRISSNHFFEELLAELTESYYSHPLAQEEIGFAGMADMHGWKAIGLNELEKHEPPEK